jgi:hypothetical protein
MRVDRTIRIRTHSGASGIDVDVGVWVSVGVEEASDLGVGFSVGIVVSVGDDDGDAVGAGT